MRRPKKSVPEIKSAAETGNLSLAAELIVSGGLVALPTETYYGLAVDPFNPAALERLFRVKKRPEDKPILVLISTIDELSRVTESVPVAYHDLIARHWPGPLTLVFSARAGISSRLTGKTATVGVRQSSSEVAAAICRLSGGVITATSANISGEPAAVTAEQARLIFGTEVDLIIDAGPAPGLQGSTVVGLEEDGALRVYRQGTLHLNSER